MRLTRAEIDLDALRFNLEGIRKKVGTDVRVMAIIKANAYGHGFLGVADALVRFGIDYFGVGFLEEGIRLRQHGITLPTLVLGGVLDSQVTEFLEHNLEITVSSMAIAGKVNLEAKVRGGGKARVHLKIDTGMERIGVRAEHAPRFIENVCRMENVEVVGVYSHLATADEQDKSFAHEQIDRFRRVVDWTRSARIEIPYFHIANSGAVLDLPESYYMMVRPGIMLYGVYPSQETSRSVPLRPVLALKSKVIFTKEVDAGTGISYGRKYVTRSRTRIATIPVGYGDGYSRRLTGTDVIIGGKRYPVVGAVCMDQFMVDIGPESSIHVGDDVTLIGADGYEEIRAWEVAEKSGTIPYEVLTGITARVPRLFLDHK